MITDILLGIVIAAWSRWRWAECGYDCGLFSTTGGPAAVSGWYLGVAITIVSLVILIFVHLKSRTGNRIDYS